MHQTLPLLRQYRFPSLRRSALHTLQVNLGYVCNQQCLHCHVGAGPRRRESMSAQTLEQVLRFVERSAVEVLDLTGGAPELNPGFRTLVRAVRGLGRRVMDRCNLTVLQEPGQEDLVEFLAEQAVEVVASLPCYLEENVNAQRGSGVFARSIEALRRLNGVGYGRPGSGLRLDLVYNPVGTGLPPAQCALEADYRRELGQRYGVVFSSLLTLANMPIQRFGSTLVSKGEFPAYMERLQGAHREENLERVMCRGLVSVDWQGWLYDCDFNQMLGLPLGAGRHHISELADLELAGRPIAVAGHCYGCTAGQGSSCGGALS